MWGGFGNVELPRVRSLASDIRFAICGIGLRWLLVCCVWVGLVPISSFLISWLRLSCCRQFLLFPHRRDSAFVKNLLRRSCLFPDLLLSRWRLLRNRRNHRSRLAYSSFHSLFRLRGSLGRRRRLRPLTQSNGHRRLFVF